MAFSDELVLEIIYKLPNECEYIDYKEVPYQQTQYGNKEFIKDVVAMLNVKEALNKDRFILIGITNDKVKIGLKVAMPDDCTYQSLLDAIAPRPSVLTGTLKDENGILFGFIHIRKENPITVYEVRKTYYYQDDGTQFKEKHGIFRGQALVRRGSVTYVLTEAERQELRNYKRQIQPDHPTVIKSKDGLKDILAAAIFGSWDESSAADKAWISDVVGMPYGEWIGSIQELHQAGSGIVTLSNSVWKVETRIELLKENSGNFYDNDLDALKTGLIKLFTTPNPKYELASDQRNAAALYQKNPVYSYVLSNGLAEFLAIMGNDATLFTSCNFRILENFIFIVLKAIFESDNWMVFATNAEYAHFFAEAHPPIFMRLLKQKILEDNSPFLHYLSESESGIFNYKYGSEYINALQVIACGARYFSEACSLLFRLSKWNEDALSKLCTILLPWYPQTVADSEKRCSLVRALIQENPEKGWKIVYQLLPGITTIGAVIIRPKYLQYGEIAEKISGEEYWKVSGTYLKMAIDLSRGNPIRLVKLVPLFDDLPVELLEQLEKGFQQSAEELTNDESRYVVWDEILNFISLKKRIDDPEDTFSKIILRIEAIAKLFIPHEQLKRDSRLFKKEQYTLEQGKKSFEDFEKEIFMAQKLVIKRIYGGEGFKGLCNFAELVDLPSIVGFAVASLEEFKDETIIIDLITSDNNADQQMACNYVFCKFRQSGIEWLNRIANEKWAKEKIIAVMTALPLYKVCWQKAEELLKENADQYWSKVPVRVFESTSVNDNNHILNSLLSVGREYDALEFAGNVVVRRSDCDPEKLATLLINLDVTDMGGHVSQYYIGRIIGKLQEEGYDREKQLLIEWKYFAVLSSENYGATPDTLYDEMGNNPDFFISMLLMRKKSEFCSEYGIENITASMQQQAWQLFYEWKRIPGSDKEGNFDAEAFYKWYQEVEEKSKKYQVLHSALHEIGKTMFYAPADSDGLFINRSIADFLQEESHDAARQGYSTESINSRGAHWMDPTGKPEFQLAKDYDEKAEAADKNGYYNLAVTLRQISKSFENEGKSNVEENNNHLDN